MKFKIWDKIEERYLDEEEGRFPDGFGISQDGQVCAVNQGGFFPVPNQNNFVIECDLKNTKRIPWPEYDENEYYDNETSYLYTLCQGGNEETTFGDIAKKLNKKFGNNRSREVCRRKAQKEYFI